MPTGFPKALFNDASAFNSPGSTLVGDFEVSNALSLQDILNITGASRTVRAYAFLNASLESSNNPLRDALDCYLPFVAAGVADQDGDQLDTLELQNFLKVKFGFSIPLYALDQFIPALSEQGHIRFEKAINAYVCIGNASQFLNEQTRTLASFDELESKLAAFAAAFEMQQAPHSSNWLEALITFLRGTPDETVQKTIKIKEVITRQSIQIEQYVIARFIDDIYKTGSGVFSDILDIFKGVLIEEFIVGCISASEISKARDLIVYFDTSLLMRLLGCSGKLLSGATAELHRYLQDLGAKTQFLPVNEGEVANIISTILGAQEFGNFIYGETGQAIERGEFSISKLKMLHGVFVERLSALNVFEAKDSVNRINNPQRFQINESGFENYLKVCAEKKGSNYKLENRRNDAQALGQVMLFRRGHKSRDALSSKYILVTGNKFLAIESRKYLMEQSDIRSNECPPILHVGQITTIIWLFKHRNLEDRLITGTLLANCYAAYRPEPEWLDKFKEALEKLGEDRKALLEDSLVLQATRRIAQDQSFGRSAILPKLRLLEILSLAETEKEQLIQQQTETGRKRGREEFREELSNLQSLRADRIAVQIVKTVQFFTIFLALMAVAVGEISGRNLGSSVNATNVALLLLGFMSTLDLFEVKLVGTVFGYMRDRVKKLVFRFLQSVNA